MIAHVGGLPFEETVAQLAPLVVGAVVVARLFCDRARSFMRSRRRALRSSVIGALVSGVIAAAASASALAEPGGNGAATITGSFSDRCRDFAARSSKDISHVELQYADGRIVKDETIDSPEYAIDGAAGDEIEAAVVKSGNTRSTYTCPATNAPPTAVLEVSTPSLDDCQWFPFPEYSTCLATDPRTVWSRPLGAALAFLVEAPYPPASLSVGFRGTSSTDPDGDIATWSLDFGDGASIHGSWTTEPPELARPFACCGDNTVTLTVVDSAGQSDADTMTLYFIDVTAD